MVIHESGTRTALTAVGAVVAFGLPLIAQQGAAVPLPAPDPEWRIPIHTLGDDPKLGPYGVWAAGPDYKVSFGRGFTFFPLLGAAYPENQPVSWRTSRIAIGDRVLADSSAEPRVSYTDWRYELRYGAVTEAYDVLPEGVEQSFVIPEHPGFPGDLVVSGQITTPLRAQAATLGHQSVSFEDAGGRELVVYGKAFAIDASGRRLDVETCFDGTNVELRVPASFVADAVFPLVVDPLTSRTRLQMGGGTYGPVNAPNIARDDFANQVMIVKTRVHAGGIDADVWGRLRRDNWNHRASAYADLSNSWSTPRASVGFVEGSGNWVIATQRIDLSGSHIRVYVHDSDNGVLNSGSERSVPQPANAYDQHPSVGGGDSVAINGRALIAFQRDLGAVSTRDTRVHAVTFDPNTLMFGVVRNLHTNSAITRYDAEWPCVTPHASNAGSWVVVWQEHNRANSNDDWDVLGQRVSAGGLLRGYSGFGPSGRSGLHKLRPIVAGQGGRYAVAFLVHDNDGPDPSATGREVRIQRFDWSESSAAPVKQPTQTIHEDIFGLDRLRTSEGNRPIAYDSDTDSHWVVAYRDGVHLRAVRCGMSGLVVERAMVHNASGPAPTATNAGVCFDDDAGEFKIVYGTGDGAVWGTDFQYLDAQTAPHGGGCAGTLHAFNRGGSDLPYAGSQFFGLELRNGLPNAPTFLFLGLAPDNIVLPGGGCPFSMDPALTFQMHAGTSDASGALRCDMPLLDTVTTADVFWQVVQVTPAAGLSTSRGLLTRIR